MPIVHGYEYEGHTVCDHHAAWFDVGDDELRPIYAWNEFDYPVHCEECGDLIRTQLTSTGLEAIRDRIRGGWRNKKMIWEYIVAYGLEPKYRYWLWSFNGRRDALGNFEDS